MAHTPEEIVKRQHEVCALYGAEHCPAGLNSIVGVSRNFDSGELPLHGLRHSLEGESSGWFLWAGEYSSDDDFFQPVHLAHVVEDHPEVTDYLGLPPGWRFLIAGQHVDVWFDRTLLSV